MDFLLAVTTATPPLDLGSDALDDYLADVALEEPDPEKGLFANWGRVGFDPEGSDRALRVALREGGSPLALICGMLEALRAHVGAHLEALRDQSKADAQAIRALRRDLQALENDDVSEDILNRLAALERTVASPPGGVA
jgi:hypothetical protein